MGRCISHLAWIKPDCLFHAPPADPHPLSPFLSPSSPLPLHHPQITMIIAALWFLAGAGLNAGAQHLWMLVVG